MRANSRQLATRSHAGVLFQYTPENVEAIVAGLNPKENEEILAICGCGDQPLALLESGARITVVDINPNQIDFFRKRVKQYLSDDMAFYGSPTFDLMSMQFWQKRLSYFSGDPRRNRILENLNKLTILPPTSLEEITTSRVFDKIYASDAISELWCLNTIHSTLPIISQGLVAKGLLYVSNSSEFPNEKVDLTQSGLRVCEAATANARKIKNFYDPAVFEKF